MQKGWDATGLLSALWGQIGGRDKLAEATGIAPTTLSGYNSGKLHLGIDNARRIAAALNVTIFDLGAPETPETDGDAPTLRTHLEELAETVARLGDAVTLLAKRQRPPLRDQLLRVLDGEPL